mgnify:CR=1 FL=1
MDDLILISNLNDFLFCPVSIYFHALYGREDHILFQTKDQLNGTHAHKAVDEGNYSTKKDIITAMEVYSEKYGVVGKIDIYDTERAMLIERKKHVKVIYDGYIFQLYAQCYAMREMGYEVSAMRIHSMDDNKNYEITLPENDVHMKERFEKLIQNMREFEFFDFVQTNAEKCLRCIYSDACNGKLSD